MYTQHYNSSGALLGTTNRIDFWDNGFQQMRDDNDFTFQIAPGDSLQTHCFFNSKQHSGGEIKFGGATADEMCMDFLFYYPAQYRGVDSGGQAQLFAFCGAYAHTSTIYTLCGGLSQAGTTNNSNPYLLTGVQVKRGDAAYADPSNFGNANQNTGGQATARAECDTVNRPIKRPIERGDENKNLWKELMPLWITLLVVSLIVLYFSVRYFVKKKNEVESDDIVKGKSTSNPVIALRDNHKKAQELSSV